MMPPRLAQIIMAVMSLFLSTTTAQQQSNDEILFFDCNIKDYYAGLLDDDYSTATAPKLREDITRNELESLLKRTHRKVLPYTNQDRDDVWKALMELDRGEYNDNTLPGKTVHLIYRQIDVPAEPHGNPDTWNREHLWPKSYGVGESGPDYTDVHHLRPSDWNVNSARNNKYFGTCGIIATEDDRTTEDCKSPAHSEAAFDTTTDFHTFLPPATVRGDIARAILYMDLRYSNQNNNGLDLTVTDCPNQQLDDNDATAPKHEMAYKSQLLEWHNVDEVTPEERYRNQRVCERWQGNRNVFVDFPDLVERLFGQPQTPLGNGLGYPGCDSNNTNQTNDGDLDNNDNSTNNQTSFSNLSSLSPGDVMVVAMNSVNPDTIALIALEDIPGNMELYLTDNAWTGLSFRSNEGTIKLVTPDSGISAGTVFGYGEGLVYGDDWESVGGRFAMSESGDTVLVYTTASANDVSSITFLAAFSYAGMDSWRDANLSEDEYGTDSSALPSSLSSTSGTTTLPSKKNYVYVGPRSGNKEFLQSSLENTKNWEGTSDPITVSQESFSVNQSNPSSSPSIDRLRGFISRAFVITIFSLAA